MIQVIGWIACFIILYRVIIVAPKMKISCWGGNVFSYIGLALSFGLAAGGSVGFMLGWEPATWMLLFGVGCYLLSDRRRVEGCC